MVNAQGWLDKNYPKEKRKNINDLNINGKNLTDYLDLSDFVNLEELYCGENKLTYLDVSGCNNLRRIYCPDNRLVELDLNKCNNLEYLHFAKNQITYLKLPDEKRKLKQLIMHENKLKQKLAFLREFIGLEELYIGGNSFYGSLEPLQNLIKMRCLDISDNDIDSGLEYLPSAVGEFHCYTYLNPQAKVRKIHKELQPFAIDERRGKYDWARWKKEKETNRNGRVQLDKSHLQKERIEIIDLNDLNFVEKIANHKSELVIDNYPNLKEIKRHQGINVNKVTISNCPQLEKIDVKNFRDNRELNIINCSNLKELDCSENQLTKLDLQKCPSLKVLSCHNNFLSELDLRQNKMLEKLLVYSNNFAQQDLSFISHLVNLKELYLGNYDQERISQGVYNRFTGSLESLKKSVMLEKLDIGDTDLNSGLEHLSDTVERIWCSNKKRPWAKVNKLYDELFFYGWNLKAWKEAHPELMIRAWGKQAINNLYDIHLTMSVIPPQLLDKEKTKIEENCNLEPINYQTIILRDKRPFSWETNRNKPLPKKLPTKLYNIKEDKIEWTKDNPNIKNYATLSYVWGQSGKVDENTIWNTQYRDKLNPAGYKSLYKAIQACKRLNKEVCQKKCGEKCKRTCENSKIGYLWMDQLCIDQNSTQEKNQEVPKMRQYYSNAAVTLISISFKNGSETNKENQKEFAQKILKKITNSEWSTRSWTFQEGFLPKQTIFMFDDVLVDGRMMAQILALLFKQRFQQATDNDFCTNLNEDPSVFVTPLGWTYCGHNWETKEALKLGNLRLSWALTAIKNRGRSIPIDTIYSILGVLPYGDQVKPKYQEKNHQYTKEEMEEALLDLMKVAVHEGYPEPLAWVGSRRNEPNKWWIPKVDEKCSTSLQGSIAVNCEPGSVEFTKNGFKLIGSRHIIDWLGKYLVNKNIRTSQIGIESNSFSAWGANETLKKAKSGDILILPNRKQWEVKNEEASEFAILVPGENNPDCPIDMIALTSDLDLPEIINRVEKKIFIDMVNKKVVELKEKDKSVDEQTSRSAKRQSQILHNPYPPQGGNK